MVRSGGSLQGPGARIDDRGVLETRRAGARLRWLVLKNAATRGSSDSVPSVGVHVSSRKRGGTSWRREGRKAVTISECAHRSLPAPPATVTQGRACPGFGWSTRARSKELGGCVHVPYRVAEVVRRKPNAQRSQLGWVPSKSTFSEHGERGLAQSGRPRRAKRHRGSNHGGQTVSSTLVSEGIRKGVAVVDLRSMEGALGRRSRSLFTRGRGKRSRPIFPSVIAKSMTCEGWATGASEVGCSRATTAGENTPCREREQVASA